ncbi:MAG: class I SAM-dependent methyltransferase [Novosphingobium sp.]
MAQIEVIERLKQQRSLFQLMKSAWYPLIDAKWAAERVLTRRCPVCSAKGPFERVRGYERTFLKCRSCTHIWAHDYSRMRALIGMGMNDFGGGEPDGGGDTEMFLARFCAEQFVSRSILLFGTGPTRAFRVLMGEGYDVYGSDVSADVIKFRQDEFGADRFFHPADIGNRKFDVVISTEVIEHFFKPVSEIRGVVDLLNPGGVFCGSTGFSKDGGVDEGPNRYMAPRGHVIYWSEASLRAAFDQLGLRLTSFALGSDFASARIFFGTANETTNARLAQLKHQQGETPLFTMPAAD